MEIYEAALDEFTYRDKIVLRYNYLIISLLKSSTVIFYIQGPSSCILNILCLFTGSFLQQILLIICYWPIIFVGVRKTDVTKKALSGADVLIHPPFHLKYNCPCLGFHYLPEGPL